MKAHRNLPPVASCLVEALRSIGYSMNTAIADIVDNSIFANAKAISVCFSWSEGDPWLAVIDNGCGMDQYELVSAMRLGSANPRDKRDIKDLGRFGLGMKTASFSQCRKLTVLSKKNELINCCQWNLDEIADSEADEWKLGILDPKSGDQRVGHLYETYLEKSDSGTIVLWELIDRVDSQFSMHLQEKAFDRIMFDVREHLDLVFHRYLSPDRGMSKVTIKVNGASLKGFDPFHSTCESVTELNQEKLNVMGMK